jgi:hypothetical protein
MSPCTLVGIERSLTTRVAVSILSEALLETERRLEFSGKEAAQGDE